MNYRFNDYPTQFPEAINCQDEILWQNSDTNDHTELANFSDDSRSQSPKQDQVNSLDYYDIRPQSSRQNENTDNQDVQPQTPNSNQGNVHQPFLGDSWPPNSQYARELSRQRALLDNDSSQTPDQDQNNDGQGLNRQSQASDPHYELNSQSRPEIDVNIPTEDENNHQVLLDTYDSQLEIQKLNEELEKENGLELNNSQEATFPEDFLDNFQLQSQGIDFASFPSTLNSQPQASSKQDQNINDSQSLSEYMQNIIDNELDDTKSSTSTATPINSPLKIPINPGTKTATSKRVDFNMTQSTCDQDSSMETAICDSNPSDEKLSEAEDGELADIEEVKDITSQVQESRNNFWAPINSYDSFWDNTDRQQNWNDQVEDNDLKTQDMISQVQENMNSQIDDIEAVEDQKPDLIDLTTMDSYLSDNEIVIQR